MQDSGGIQGKAGEGNADRGIRAVGEGIGKVREGRVALGLRGWQG